MKKSVELEHTGAAQHELEHSVLTTASLIKAFVIAGLLAAAVLVTAILPAEYGIDPTGAGEAMGLMPLANRVTAVNVSELSQNTDAAHDPANREDSVKIVVPAGSGLEYKFHLQAGDNMRYSWKASGAVLFYDFHGEPDGDTSGYFESHTISHSDEVSGSFTAPFAGSHGWYWENDSEFPAVVTLTTKGSYQVIGVK